MTNFVSTDFVELVTDLHNLLAPSAPLWLVGGVVRDGLLKRELFDVDLVTPAAADVEPLARSIARIAKGTAFPLGDEHGCWRIALSPRGDKDNATPPTLRSVQQVDICALRGETIGADLSKRDFTVNAMAVDTSNPEQIIDPHSGLVDLEQQIIRMVSEAAFDDDPLRMIRAARFAHTLGWEIDPATIRAIRYRRAKAAKPATERTFSELSQLLLHSEAKRGWRILELLELEGVLFPELELCKGLEQSAFHHLDVYDHTLAVLDNCDDILTAHRFWLPLNAPLSADDFSDKRRLTTLLSALFHDIGKPQTRTKRADGRVSFAGHDQVGAEIVTDIAHRFRWSNELKQGVKKLVATHLKLGFALHSSRDDREKWRLLRAFDPYCAEAVVLSVGDRLATSGPADRRSWVRAHLHFAREVWTRHWRERHEGLPAPLLDGSEIIAIIKSEPGPIVGQLVQALAEEQAVGGIKTRSAAESFILDHEEQLLSAQSLNSQNDES